ncbi:MAG: hypothetical protein MUF39_10410, partial [Cyclobacteriaceae bacterium]|nr:hypothetical protein [Cyclobacteriaceae bacterium]
MQKVGVSCKFLFFLLLIPSIGYAQYANDWIKQGQSYYRIPVARQGIYKLTYDDLQSAGVPVAAIDPRLIQIFHRGKEQSIYVQGQADAVFNTSDYIEFFGQPNDGTLDKGLYKPSSLQPHNYYNLYSDSTAYFLTWNFAVTPGKRVEVFDEVNVTNIPKDEFHTDEKLLVNKSEYSPGRTSNDVIQYTHFDQGEGWTGARLQPGQSLDYTIDQITNTFTTAAVPQLEILLVGLDDSEHTATVFVGPNTSSLRSLGAYTFSGFEAYKITSPINWNDLGGGEQLVVRLSASAPAGNRPQFSTSYIKLNYSQNFQSAGINEKVFTLSPVALGKSYLEFENAPATFRLWD